MAGRLHSITLLHFPEIPSSTEQNSNTTQNSQNPTQNPHTIRNHFQLMLLAGLTLVALIPRILLALRLDMLTDEAVYISGGKIYFPLLLHHHITDQGWLFNYEHPAFAKLCIGLALWLNTKLGQPFSELLVARLPGIIAGTLLVVALYWLGRGPFGRAVALLAALCLAFSPWLVYFSALAYLDMTMTMFITSAYLLLWHALRRPSLYVLAAILLGVGAASKYPAALALPGAVLFVAYYFLGLRPRLPAAQRRPVPWRWWIISVLACPLAFLLADPALWPDPYGRLLHSFAFNWLHATTGHLTFIAGQASSHVPHWTILYTLFVKVSVFVTIPAACFVVFALVQQIRFQLGGARTQGEAVTRNAFLLLWLLVHLGMFSLLTIAVGSHYYLPLAPPLALAGASGMALLVGYRGTHVHLFRIPRAPSPEHTPAAPPLPIASKGRALQPRTIMLVTILSLILVGPHLFGLLTVPDADGYTSEVFVGENAVMQVAYPGYRDALDWLADHTTHSTRVGLGALQMTLLIGAQTPSWYYYNQHFTRRFQLTEVHPGEKLGFFEYMIWPMHLVQRGYPIPEPWRAHIIHTIDGGATTYCYIAAYSGPITAPGKGGG